MALLDIITYPDPRLKVTCDPVKDITDDIRSLLNNMAETMYAAPGIGLAAPQVGISKRIIVIDVSEECNSPLVLINPSIVEVHGKAESEEGCLSVPDYRDVLTRSAEVLVKGLDLDGNEVEVEADDLLARCLQHEIDHLDGILFFDHLSRIKKEFFKRWAKKQEM